MKCDFRRKIKIADFQQHLTVLSSVVFSNREKRETQDGWNLVWEGDVCAVKVCNVWLVAVVGLRSEIARRGIITKI